MKTLATWRSVVFVLMFFVVSAQSQEYSSTKTCQILGVKDDKYAPVVHSIVGRGRYCLNQDVYGHPLPNYSKAPSGYGHVDSMLLVASPTVVIDFLGHSLKSDFVDRSPSKRRKGASGVGAVRTHSQSAYPGRKLRLLNGHIDLVGVSDGVGIPPKKSERQPHYGIGMDWDLFSTSRVANLRKWFAEVIRRPTENLVDNMSIKAGLTGVTMMGQRNTIRNSRIEMNDALAAINLFGPDNLIENNILIFRGQGRRPSAAPVILHAGGRTVIRNNVIIVDSPRPNQAVSLTASDGVVLENNRVYGALRFVREFDQLSSFVSRGNRMLAPAPEGLVPRDARRADEVPLF